MRYPKRVTICISSQAGCGMNCPFCATGQAGLTRNLSTAEIVEQVRLSAAMLRHGEVSGGTEESPLRVSNVVFMGMGEALANYKAAIGAIRRLTLESTSWPRKESRSRSRCLCMPPTTSCGTSSSRSTPGGMSTKRSMRPTDTSKQPAVGSASNTP